MYTDMLCRIITETPDAHLHEVVHEFHIIFLEQRILGIHVRKSSNALQGAFSTVVVVIDAFKTLCVEHLLPASDCFIEGICNEIDIKGRMVRKDIHEYTDIRVLLTGEISDELFGCKYTDFAPSAAAATVPILRMPSA